MPLLLTHGFGATAGMWDSNIDALIVDRPAIVWDQRGHGSSDAPDDMARYSEEISVADMAAVLDAAGADRAVLCGCPWAATCLWPSISLHPQRVAALVLVDTGPGYRNDEARDKWNDWVERTARRLERGQRAGRHPHRRSRRPCMSIPRGCLAPPGARWSRRTPG